MAGDRPDRADANRELRLVDHDGSADPELVAFARSFFDAHRRGSPLSDAETRAAVGAYVARHCELAPAAPLVVAKRELEKHFDCDLSMAHVSAVAGLHPETFARHFRATFGPTPATYRVMLRLNFASRLCWTSPDLSVADIAETCGFRNRAYFQRTFHRAFGSTPLEARERAHGAAASL